LGLEKRINCLEAGRGGGNQKRAGWQEWVRSWRIAEKGTWFDSAESALILVSALYQANSPAKGAAGWANVLFAGFACHDSI
jgi:hypothetical protein